MGWWGADRLMGDGSSFYFRSDGLCAGEVFALIGFL